MVEQPFERYPALATWIERLANTQSGLSLGEWMVFLGCLNNTIVQAETRSPIHVPPTCPENGEKLTGQGWRDIESAPRDGTLILACQRPDEGSCWFKTWEQWKAPQTVAWRGYHVNAPGKDTWRDGKGSPVMPDLWMPLDVLSVQP